MKKRYWILAGIVLFFVIILTAVPRVAKWYIVRHSNEYIGRNLAIDKIRLNYFTGTLRIAGFKLYEADGKTTFVSFNRLKVNLDYLPLFRKEIQVKYITLDKPYVQVLQDGDKFNFTDLTQLSDTTGDVTDTIPSAPTKYIINNIGITGGYLRYTDIALNHTISMDNLDLEIPGFTWNSDSTNLNIDLRFVDGGGLFSSLDVNQADSTYSVSLKLDSLNLGIIEPYIKSSLYISALRGYLSSDLKIRGNMRSVMQLFIRGVNHIYGLQLSDTLNRTILSFNDLAVDIDTILLDRNRIDLNSVSITDPFLLFELIDTTNNLSALVKPPVEVQADTVPQAADTATEAAAVSYTFPKIHMSGGRIQISDRTMRYPFSYTIDNLTINCTESPKDPGKLMLSMSAGLNGTGTFTADALINPEDPQYIDINAAIGQFRMKDMEPYFMHYVGYPITGGIMNFKTDDQMKPKSLVSNNTVYFRKFTLAERADNNCEYKIPVRLALGVLSDKDGIIDLKAPVESKGDEVKVKNLGKIIFRIIGNLFVKAALSPFNALSGLYNVDPASLQEIKLDLMDPEPDENNMKSVDVIADIIGKKPGLNVDLYYCIDRNRANDSLAYLLARNDFVNDSKSRGIVIRDVADSTLLKFILSRSPAAATQENRQLNNLCRTYTGEGRVNAALDSLRTIQTNFMTSYLGRDKALPADRFRVITTAPDTIKPPLDYPAFRIYFNAGAGNQP